MKKILLIEGDGIGPEVVSQTKKLLIFLQKIPTKNLK